MSSSAEHSGFFFGFYKINIAITCSEWVFRFGSAFYQIVNKKSQPKGKQLNMMNYKQSTKIERQHEGA